MNITCALSSSQIKGLFQYVYKTMAESLADKKVLNADEVMKNLFDKIEKNKDADTAAKFLQIVPQMIGIASFQSNLIYLKVDPKSDTRELAQKFMNSETGLLDVLQYFRPKDIIKEIQNDVNIKNNSINSPKFTEDTDIPVSPRYKASSAFTTTMQQFITRDPNNKLTIEEIDPNKVRIYNTIEKLKTAFNTKDNSVLNPTYQGRVLNLKGVRLDSVAANLDKTTAALLAKANSIAAKGSGVNFLKDAIVLMVTDEFGTPINFSEEGDITSKEEGGKPVYQFLRNVTVDEETGDYTVKDIYGKEERIQSVDDLVADYAKNAYKTSLETFKKKYKEDYEETYQIFKEQQQADFKALLDIHKEILKEKEKLFDIMDISAGIPLDFTGGNMPLNDFLKLSDNLNTNYKFTTLRTERDLIGAGNTVISINGYDIPVDRKNMSEDLVNKIAAALVNTDMTDVEKYNFYDQFSHNNINFKDKKLFVVYKPESGLEVSYKEDAKNPERKLVDLTNKEIAKAIIIKALGTERKSSKGDFYAANMKINADLLEKSAQFFDYDLLNDEPVPASYREFLSKVNPTVKFKNNEPGVYNSYFAFRVNDKLSKELKKAKEKVQEKTYTTTDSYIRQAKDALLIKLAENANISGTVIDGVTRTTFIIQVDGKSVQGRFEEGLSITSVPENKTVTFSVGDKVEDGKLITDVISIYAGDKKIGQVSETDYKAEEKPRTYADAAKADDKANNPVGVPQPSDKKSKRSGISKLWDRSSKLPSDVTREEVDAAQEWWENSPLSKFIELEHMANIVNSDVYARFVIAGKRLEDVKIQLDTATGSSAVDLYHEAWHAFSQLYLTREQKTKLYAETRKKLNNFDLSPEEVEEIIAEDFRTYAKNPKPKADEPIRNSIFRKIWNFIKAFFGKRNTKDELFKELFFASKNPKLLNKYTPLVDNHIFSTLNRDRGILNVETKELALSFQDSMTVSSQIDSALSELIDEIYTDRVEREKQGEVGKNNVPIKATRNGTISLLTNDKDKAIAYETIYERFEDNLAYFQDQLDTADEDDYNKVTLLTDKVRILKAAIENWGDSKSGVVKFHIDNSTFDLIKQNYIEIEAEDEVDEDKDNSAPENTKDSEKYADKKVGDQSLLQLAEKETLYIIKSLFKIADGKQVMGKLGFPELADFSKTWNIVTKVIGGEKDPVKMYQKLVAGIESFPELKQLIENKIPDPREIHNIEEFNIKAAFWQDFKKTKLKYLQLTVDNPDGTEYKSEVTEASIEFTNIISKFKSEFKASPKSTYINKGDDNKSILNLNKVIADFDTGTFDSRKSIQFARAIGINLQDLSALKRELDYNKDDYGIQYLFDVTKSIHKISKDPNASTEHKNFIKKFLSDPIGALYGQIPKGIHEKATSEKNIIQKLAKLQSAFGTNYSSFSVLNPEKNLVNEFIEDNTVSMIVDAINNVSSGNALWTSDEYQYMSYLNPEINGFTLQSQILKNIFEYSNNTLNERKGDAKIELAMVAGSQIVDEKGANTTSLDVQSKYIQELNMMLKGGIVEFMRHASKSSSFGMRLANGVSGGLGKANVNSKLYVDIDMFGPNGNADQYAVNNIFIGYIQAELTRIQKFKGNKELFKQYNGYNRNVGTKENPIYAGEQFTAFDNVLKDFTTTINGEEKTMDLKQYLIDNVKDGDLKNYLKSNPEIKKAITEQVTKYFNGQADKNYKQFSDSPFYDPALMNRLNVFTTLEEEDKHKLLVKAYTMNAWIHNFETASLIYGDIVQYNHAKQELHKRNTGSTSGGRGFMDDIYTQQFLNSDLIKKSSYAFKLANKAGYGADYNTFNYSNKYNTAIMQDVSRNSVYLTHIEKGLRDDYVKRGVEKDEIEKRIAKEIAKYNKMEEGDGQGFIAIDAYRNLRLAEKSWSADQEKLFQDIINEKEIKAEDVVRFFPVYKLQHFGHLANTMLPVNAMHKFALMPLIPSMIKGSDLESLHHQMMKSNIQYATFQTGSKTGSVTSQLDKNGKAVADQIYDDNGVEKTLKSDIKFTPNTIYLANLKNVTAVPTKYKGKTVFSTQLRKNILEGLYQDGEIVNKDYAPYIKAYETAIDDYTDLLKTELLEEIGYEKVDGKYVSGDISKFMDVVQRELERKDLPEHLIKYIQVGKDNKITKDLSLHLLADDIEKILVSLVEKRIVKQKVKGEALVQVASSMSNGLWDSGFKFDKANTKDIEKYLGSNNLPFYYPGEDGKTNAMKVAIALQGDFKNLLKLNHIDKQPIGTRERLNEMIKNDEWLNKGNNRKAITMTAVRIPVQGLNSMEFMEVYEFLDPSAGNIIIPPSEIVAKSGADFDVDKLTTFMPNIDAEGHYIETSMDAKKLETKINAAKKSGDKGEIKRLIKMQKAALENRLIDSIKGILELPDNYATLVRPNDTYLLKDIADELVESSPEYKEFKTISPTNVLEVGYNLHKHEANMVGKDVLGIIALENALHPLLTSLGAALPKTYKHQTWDNENKRYIEVPEIDYEMRLLLNHNKTSDGRISLSKINSSDNQDKIADLISHLMNGSVDVEKDAWIFFIQANTEIVPVLLSLLKAGVPKREAIYFVSQPLVKEYARQQRLIGSAFANVTDNGVSANENEKYIALQNTLAVSGISFRYPYLSRDASNLKMFDALKATKDNVKVKFKDGTFKVFAPKELLKAIANNTIKKNNISDIYNAVVKYKLDEDGIPELDEYGKKIQIPLYKKVNDSHLLSNDNWYYVTQVLTKDVNKFSEAELKTNIDNNDFTSDSAIRAFLHFVEFEKEIKGLSNLKRQANPDTKTSKTIQEVTQKSLSLDEAADSSKIEPELARKLQEESILGTFFDKMIITDVVSPLFNVTNNKNVSDHMIKSIARKGGQITKKFGEGKDGVEAYITAYKNAIVNYIYQNKLNKIITTEESFPGIPESFTDIDSKEYIDNFMAMLSEHSHLKELYPILEQITDIPVRSKKDGEVTYTTTLTLNNKSVVKGALAEAYHQNLLDLADDNIIKVNDPEQNKEISDMFKMLPLMSILQNGVGSTKYGLSYVLPDTTFFEIIEPASREFLALNSESKDKTLDIIDNLLFDNGVGENNYILSRASRKASNLSKTNVDEEVEDEEYVPKGVASASGQGMTFGTQQQSSDTKINIYAGTGENAELSNFAERPVKLGNETFRTPEGAYQAMKIWFTNAVLLGAPASKENLEILEKLKTASGKQAKALGREITDLSDGTWDRDSSGVMKNILKLSFEQNPNALAKLLVTGNATLTHTQDKGKWGTEFPKLLMEVREELRGTQSTQSSTSVGGFQGYKGDFENTGKGTPEGDGKDKAMREVAGGFILELEPKRENDSSTGTTAKEYPNYREGVMVSSKNFYNDVVMLARNNEFKNKPLSEDTKRSILDAHDEGVSFVVGDMPGVDSQFIDYLQEIGAKFTIYHTGTTPRIQVKATNQPSTSINEFDLADSLTPIQQNFADGSKFQDTNGQWQQRKMQDKFKGKSAMDLIISGDRTRTTRAKTDMQRMAKDYGLSKLSDLVGKVIRMTDKTGRQVYTRITKVAPFTQEYQDATWQKEGWVKSVTDRHVGDYPYAIEFELVSKPTTQPSTTAVKPESLLDKETLSYFKSGVDQGIEAIKKQYEERLKNLEYLSKKTALSGITQDEYDKKVNYINAEYNGKISKAGKIRYRINLESARDIELAELKRKYEDTTQSSTSVAASKYTNYSGGAKGGDTVWAEVGKEYGLGKQVDYTPDTLQKLTATQVQEVETAYQKAVKDLGRNPLPYDWNDPNKKVNGKSIYYSGGLVRRDYLQAKAADAVFAIGNILTPGSKNKDGYIVKSKTDSVDGGTGYAVQMAINLGKPVYVFDQTYEKWFAWEDGKFRISNVPTLTTKFAGVGTREINEAGKQAIRDVYANTFKATTQQQGVTQTVKAYRTSDTFSSKVNYAQRGSGVYYGLDKPFQEMGADNKVEEVTVSYNPSKTLDATTEEGQTIFMQIKRSAIEGESFPSMKESNNAVADAMRANGYESLIGWIDQDVKDAGRELVIYNQPAQQQAPVGEVKEGVEDLFKDKPELSSIGTPEQYSNWLNFLTTQGRLRGTRATDILYHGTDKEFDTFDKTKRGSATGESYSKDEAQTPIDSLNAFFFSSDSDVSKQYSLLRRVEEIDTVNAILINSMIDLSKLKGLRTVLPELYAHLKQKQTELNREEFKDYVRNLSLKYNKVNKELGVEFLNEYKSNTVLGKQLKYLQNKKQDILSGNYVHNSFMETHPKATIYFPTDPHYGIKIYDNGDILHGPYSRKNITELTAVELDDLLNIGNASYKRKSDIIDNKIKKAKITPILYRVLLNVQKPLVKDFEGQTFVDQVDKNGAISEASKLTDKAAKSKGEYDSVIYKNIRDPYLSDNYGVFEPEQVYILGGKTDQQGFKNFVKGNTQRQTEDETTDEDVQSDNTVTYKPVGKETQTYTIKDGSIFNENGDEVFKEASSDRNKIFANLAVRQGRAVVVEHRTYTDKEGIEVTAKYVVNNKDVIISVRTGDIMKWPENNGDRKAVIALAKAAFAEAASEEPEINQDMEAFNAEVTKQGKLPTEFIVDQRKWVLNNMKLYDLVDKSTGMMFMKNMNMFTGAQVQEIPSNKPVNRKQLINFTKQLSSGITSYKLDQILAEKGIDINDVYGAIEKITTQDQLNNLINKILKAIC